jgi:hypothetical protein
VEAVRRLEGLEALIRYGSAPAARSLRSSKKNPAGVTSGVEGALLKQRNY